MNIQRMNKFLLILAVVVIFMIAVFIVPSTKVAYAMDETPTTSNLTEKYFPIDGSISYPLHNCDGQIIPVQDWKPILGVEIYGNEQYFVIGKITGDSTNGYEVSGISQVVTTLPYGNYYLVNDLMTTETIEIASGRTISLCLNGHELTADASSSEKYSVITVNGNFYLYGGTDENAVYYGYWDNEYKVVQTVPSVSVYDKFTGGIITGGHAENGGGIYVSETGSLNILGGSIVSNTATECGGGIYSETSLNINHGAIVNNRSGSHGGGIYSKGIINIGEEPIDGAGTNSDNAVQIIGNTADSDKILPVYAAANGGGVYSEKNCNTYVGDIKHNKSNADGGGIYSAGSVGLGAIHSELSEKINITNNSANGNGGGVYASTSLYYHHANVSNNSAGASGGGIYVAGEAFTNELGNTEYGALIIGRTVDDSAYVDEHHSMTINGNKANAYGGGIYSAGSMWANDKIVVDSNSANGHGGGGLYVVGGGSSLSYAEIKNNSSQTTGGGAYFVTGATINNSTFESNEATTNGGGLYAQSGIYTNDSVFRANTSGTDGGGIYIQTGYSQINMTMIDDNTSTAGNGGGLYAQSAIETNKSIFQNNDAQNGGGIYFAETSWVKTTDIKDNTASANGGGIYFANGGAFGDVDKNIVSGNTAENGGGVYLAGGSFTTNGQPINDNTATKIGGGVYVSPNSYIDVAWAEINSNKAGEKAGGLYAGGNTVLNLGSVKITENTVDDGSNAVANNLYIPVRTHVKISAGNTNGWSDIGVTKERAPGSVAGGLAYSSPTFEGYQAVATDTLAFKSDDKQYSVSHIQGSRPEQGVMIVLLEDITGYEGEYVIDLNTDGYKKQSGVYNGKEHNVIIDLAKYKVVEDGDNVLEEELTQNKDYYIAWYSDSSCQTKVDKLINAGTYYGQVNGMGEYCGTYDAVYEYVITKDTVKVAHIKTSDGASTFTYNGKPQTLVVTIAGENSKEQIIATTENSTITWSTSTGGDVNFQNAGTYTATLTALTDSNHTVGTKNKAIFKISRKALNNENIYIDDVKNQSDDIQIDGDDVDKITLKDGETLLVKGTDYTISWKYSSSFMDGAIVEDYAGTDFAENGVYTATITCVGNYKGDMKVTYKHTTDVTPPEARVYEDVELQMLLGDNFINQWHGNTGIVLMAKESNIDSAIEVAGMDSCVITINGKSYDFNKDTAREGYLANGVVTAEENAYANATHEIVFKTTVISTGNDSRVQTALKFNPQSANKYAVKFVATDRNGQSSKSLVYANGQKGDSTVIVCIDPRVDKFNVLYNDILTKFDKTNTNMQTVTLESLKTYFATITSETTGENYENLLLVYDVYKYHAELEKINRDVRIEGVTGSSNTVGSNEVSWENYRNLMQLYNSINHEEVDEYITNKSLAEALKEAVESVENAINNQNASENPTTQADIIDKIEAMEDIYNQINAHENKDGIYDELSDLLDDDSSVAGTKGSKLPVYIEKIEDYIVVKDVIVILESKPENRTALNNIIDTWDDLSDKQKLVAESMKADDLISFENKIAEDGTDSSNESYTEIRNEVISYEEDVVKSVNDTMDNWSESEKETIKDLVAEYSSDIASPDRITDENKKFLKGGTVKTVKQWQKDLEEIAKVEELITNAITAVNDTDIIKDERFVNTNVLGKAKDSAIIAKQAFDALFDGLKTAVSNYNTASDEDDFKDKITEELAESTISGILSDATDLVEVIIKIEALTNCANEELDGKYSKEDIEQADAFEQEVLKLNIDKSTVYEILHTEHLYNNLTSNAKELVRNKATLEKFVEIAGDIYDGKYETTVDSNGEFIGYLGHNFEDYDDSHIVCKIYNLYNLEYENWNLSDFDSNEMIRQINQELVELIYGIDSKVEYDDELHDFDKDSPEFLNKHHAFLIDGDTYYIHDDIWDQIDTQAGFMDFAEIQTDASGVNSYSADRTERQKIIYNSVGVEYDYLVDLFNRLMAVHIAENNVPDKVEDENLEEYYHKIEIVKMRLERLSNDERLLLGKDLDKINEQYKQLIEHINDNKDLGISYRDNATDVTVIGLATQVDYGTQEYDSMSAYVEAKPIDDKTYEGLDILVGYNVKLKAKVQIGQITNEKIVQPDKSKGYTSVAILPIPNNALISSLVLYHISDDKVNTNIIEDVTFFHQDSQLYASFTTDSYSDFIFIGESDLNYVEPPKKPTGGTTLTPPLNVVKKEETVPETEKPVVKPTEKPTATVSPQITPSTDDKDIQENKDENAWIWWIVGGVVILLIIWWFFIVWKRKKDEEDEENEEVNFKDFKM